MLEFSEDFFKEEVRDGFTISEEMKRTWAAELKVLDSVIQVCKRHGIQYYACYGTLLGAVRHHGFVPWDDDMDITVKRNDYTRLLKLLGQELPDYYAVNSIYTSDKHRSPVASVGTGSTLPLSDEVVAEFFGCQYIVGIDIYSIDYVPRDKEMADTQLHIYNAIYDFAMRYDEISRDGEAEKYLKELEEICNITFDRDKDIVNQLWMLGENISSMFNDDECDKVTHLPKVVRGHTTYYLDKDVYSDVVMMPFENIRIAVPVGYDAILKAMYGDYHKEVRGASAHSYPFYAEQKEYLKKIGKLR